MIWTTLWIGLLWYIMLMLMVMDMAVRGMIVEACYRPSGHSDNKEDCNDEDAEISPDAIESLVMILTMTVMVCLIH